MRHCKSIVEDEERESMMEERQKDHKKEEKKDRVLGRCTDHTVCVFVYVCFASFPIKLCCCTSLHIPITLHQSTVDY
jgi:cytochrome c oxidase assembly protein Cox11